tara:strand:+ start:27747 stop:28031 length:285 start_codon:yes stop_codon:yes gene_type:complete
MIGWGGNLEGSNTVMSVDFWIAFLGWMAFVNGAFLIIGTLVLALAREWIIGAHSAMTGVDRAQLPVLYFSYLGNFKIAWIVLNLVPYLVLRFAM